MDDEEFKRASSLISSMSSDFEKLRNKNDIAGIFRLLAPNVDTIITVNGIAKEKALQESTENRKVYYPIFKRSTEMLDTIQSILEKDSVEKEGLQRYRLDMQSLRKYLGDELFERANKIWI